MKLIELSKFSRKNNGKFFALVDDEDYDYFNQWDWYALKNGATYYVIRNQYHSETKKTNQNISS